jgi:hypothetical protein
LEEGFIRLIHSQSFQVTSWQKSKMVYKSFSFYQCEAFPGSLSLDVGKCNSGTKAVTNAAGYAGASFALLAVLGALVMF